MELRRDVFQAIADPTRRAIMTLVAMQAMTPGAPAQLVVTFPIGLVGPPRVEEHQRRRLAAQRQRQTDDQQPGPAQKTQEPTPHRPEAGEV